MEQFRDLDFHAEVLLDAPSRGLGKALGQGVILEHPERASRTDLNTKLECRSRMRL